MVDGTENTEFREMTRLLYEVISAPHEERDWDSTVSLFHPRATMVRTGLDENGQPFAMAMSHTEYIANVTELLEHVVFREVELRLDATVFGNVARLASVYQFRYQDNSVNDSGRGVNFFNLINEGDGWKIMNIVWDNERPGVSLRDAGLL